jgi:23S rRNA pseudouridine1911/1915/1917 synthase
VNKTQNSPYVYHEKSTESSSLRTTLVKKFSYTQEKSQELIELGSVYVQNKRCIFPEHILSVGDYIRVHHSPFRYDPELFLKEIQIEKELPGLLVVYKPAGLPCISRVDNIKENLIAFVEKKFQIKTHITHRLDIPTSGLIVLATDKDSQSTFNKMLIHRQVQKFYQARVEGAFNKTGLIEHWMMPSDTSPKILSTVPQEGYLNCRLEILTCEYNASENSTNIKIELLTGRTHQIRAQMSALGHPLIGDLLYGAKDQNNDKHIKLKATDLAFNWKNEFYKIGLESSV